MTPQEKALDLCQKYGYLGLKWKETKYRTFPLENTKQCALIVVNEVISSNPHSNPLNTNVESTMSYWQEVKQEIEKL